MCQRFCADDRRDAVLRLPRVRLGLREPFRSWERPLNSPVSSLAIRSSRRCGPSGSTRRTHPSLSSRLGIDTETVDVRLDSMIVNIQLGVITFAGPLSSTRTGRWWVWLVAMRSVTISIAAIATNLVLQLLRGSTGSRSGEFAPRLRRAVRIQAAAAWCRSSSQRGEGFQTRSSRWLAFQVRYS